MMFGFSPLAIIRAARVLLAGFAVYWLGAALIDHGRMQAETKINRANSAARDAADEAEARYLACIARAESGAVCRETN